MGFKKWITGGYQAEALAQRLQWQLGGLRLEETDLVIGSERRSVKGVSAAIIDGNQSARVSAGRVIAGGVAFGPAGAIIGALAKKHQQGDGAILIDGADFQVYLPFKAALTHQARALVAAINTAARQA